MATDCRLVFSTRVNNSNNIYAYHPSALSAASDGTIPLTKEDGKLENGQSPIATASPLDCDAYQVLPCPELMDGTGTGKSR